MTLTKEERKLIVEKLGREPNDVEWGVFELNWSEHCSYKTSKPFLRKLPKEGERVIMGPGENAGVLDIGDGYVVAFKVESHNHPSAIEPFNGAATGVGGIVRDILATGCRPIALLDSLRFGTSASAKQLLEGVVRGISFYGNAIGVPTVGGETFFEECYEDNPLVNVMCVGIGRKEKLKPSKLQGVGNSILIVGNRTGRDGIHGATFASEVLEGDEDLSAVQIGDPFTQKLLIEAIQEVISFPELLSIQDLGAGGLSTAIPEMATKGGVGALIHLDNVPLRASNMTPYEILLSESQERMLLCVERGSEAKFGKVFNRWKLNWAKIGEVIEERRFVVFYRGRRIVDLPTELLTEGVPIRTYVPKKPSIETRRVNLKNSMNLRDALVKMLSSPNLSSKHYIYEQYDYMVGLNTVVEPSLDASVVRIKGQDKALALTIDGNGRYMYIDPYEGARIAVYEASRNVLCVGGYPIGLTDNINFPNPEVPENYWYLEPLTEGLRDAALRLNVPFVSGNVSLYNESPKHRIYPTITVGMVGLIEGLSNVIVPYVREGDELFLVGKLEGKIGGSEFLKVLYRSMDYDLDSVDDEFELEVQKVIRKIVELCDVHAIHDVAEGGLLISVVELCMHSHLGFTFEEYSYELDWLFGEWQTRFLLVVDSSFSTDLRDFLENKGISYVKLGRFSGKLLRLGKHSWDIQELSRIYKGG